MIIAHNLRPWPFPGGRTAQKENHGKRDPRSRSGASSCLILPSPPHCVPVVLPLCWHPMKPATSRLRRAPHPPQVRGSRKLPPVSPERAPVPVLIAYSDVSSARQALTHIGRMLHLSHPRCLVQPMLWRFDQLLKPNWHQMALGDARRAVILALAVSHEAAFAQLSEGWLTALLERATGHHLHVLVMVGDADPWTIQLEQGAVSRGSETAREQTRPDQPPVKVPGRPRRSKQGAAVAA